VRPLARQGREPNGCSNHRYGTQYRSGKLPLGSLRRGSVRCGCGVTQACWQVKQRDVVHGYIRRWSQVPTVSVKPPTGSLFRAFRVQVSTPCQALATSLAAECRSASAIVVIREQWDF
jgi:hypothetical protein